MEIKRHSFQIQQEVLSSEMGGASSNLSANIWLDLTFGLVQADKILEQTQISRSEAETLEKAIWLFILVKVTNEVQIAFLFYPGNPFVCSLLVDLRLFGKFKNQHSPSALIDSGGNSQG